MQEMFDLLRHFKEVNGFIKYRFNVITKFRFLVAVFNRVNIRENNGYVSAVLVHSFAQRFHLVTRFSVNHQQIKREGVKYLLQGMEVSRGRNRVPLVEEHQQAGAQR
jgi:hypothetical protein